MWSTSISSGLQCNVCCLTLPQFSRVALYETNEQIFSWLYVLSRCHFCIFLCVAVGKVSASYIALISWLLSLVAMDTDVIGGAESVSAPFHVIGLQQMLVDGQLGFHAAVIPVKQFTTRDLRSRSKVSWPSIIYCVITSRLVVCPMLYITLDRIYILFSVSVHPSVRPSGVRPPGDYGQDCEPVLGRSSPNLEHIIPLTSGRKYFSAAAEMGVAMVT